MKKIIICLFLTLSMFAKNIFCFSTEPNPINKLALSGFTKYVDALGRES